ncbi:MAG: hypothetical protein ACSLEX_04400 [Minisyncoccota bacterium]|jgi:hypothetical protein
MPTAECTVRTAHRVDVPAMAALIKEFAHYMRELGDTTELCLDSEVLQRDGFGKGSTKTAIRLGHIT